MPSPSDITDWHDFLHTNGCTNIQDHGTWIMCNCPFHNQSDTTRPSFGIFKESGMGNCFGCGTHSWKTMCELFGIDSDSFVDGVKENVWKSFTNRLFKKEKDAYKRFKLPINLANPYGVKNAVNYIISHGLSKEAIEHFGIRVCMDRNSIYFNHLIFPIHDHKDILFFDARYIGGLPNMPRWRTPKGAPRWRAYFNWQYGVKQDYLCFVEGATDVVKFWGWGIKNTIAAKNFSNMQYRMILRSGVKHILLGYDNDEAGELYTDNAIEQFKNSGINISVLHFPKGCKDPGDIKSFSRFLRSNKVISEVVKYV